MVISIALLGFGASGTLLAAIERRRRIPPCRCMLPKRAGSQFLRHRLRSRCRFLSGLRSVFLLTRSGLSGKRGKSCTWDATTSLLSVPFFAAATAIGLALTSESEKCPRLYAYNMAGSGAGALLAMVALSFARVEWAMVGVMGLAQGAAVVALLDKKLFVDRGSRWFFAAAGVAIMAIVTLAYIFRPPTVRLSQYKGLSYALNLPHARGGGRAIRSSRPYRRRCQPGHPRSPGSFASRANRCGPATAARALRGRGKCRSYHCV